jgi:hypothetical protein
MRATANMPTTALAGEGPHRIGGVLRRTAAPSSLGADERGGQLSAAGLVGEMGEVEDGDAGKLRARLLDDSARQLGRARQETPWPAQHW